MAKIAGYEQGPIGKLGKGSVDADELAPNAVTGVSLAAGSVDRTRLASDVAALFPGTGKIVVGAGATTTTRYAVPYRDIRDFYTSSDTGNYAPAIQRAAADLAGSPGEIVLPNRAEAFRTLVDLPSGVTVRGSGSASELVFDTDFGAAYRFFRAYGSVGTRTALTSDAVGGTRTVTVPTGTGAGFVVGDLIELRSEYVAYGAGGKTKDIRKVMGVSGDTLTIDARLIYTFAVTDGATIGKVVDVRRNVMLRDFLTSNTNPATNKGYLFDARVGENIRVQDVTQRDAGGGILIGDSLFPRVTRYTVDHQPNGWKVNVGDPGLGYGVVFTGTTSGGIVDGLQARNVRHAFTTLNHEGYGGPRDCLIVNGVSFQGDIASGTSHWDTHEFGDNNSFANCIADGGGDQGFQNRAHGTTYTNCWSHGSTNRGFNMQSTGREATIQGGGVIGAGQNAISASSPSGKVNGVTVLRNTGAGVIVGADDVTVVSCRIEDNQYGIQHGSGLRPVYQGNVIPASAKQTVAILNAPATATIFGNVALGYAAETNAFLGANAGARIRNNITTTGGTRFVFAGASTINPSDATLRVIATAGVATVNLPASVDHTGRMITIKKADATANAVTIAPAGSDTIDGAATKTLGSAWSSIQLVSVGPSWSVVSQMGTVT